MVKRWYAMGKEPLRYERKSNRENSMHKVKADSTPTMNQLKLAIATELKSEGYNIVMFDKPIEACGRRTIAHVYCEDNLRLRIAVYCINRPSQVRPDEILDTIELIKNSVEDCDVALAFPLALLPKARVLIGLTSRVYILDDDGRVWVHYPLNGMHGNVAWAPLGHIDPKLDEDSEAPSSSIEATHMRLPYIA